MTVALTESRMLFRFAPKVPLSSRRSAAAQVVWRSSHMRTGRPLQSSTVFASLRLLAARSPSVPSIFSGRPIKIISASISLATSHTRAATLLRAFKVIWGVMAVVRNSVRSQVARPVRLSP